MDFFNKISIATPESVELEFTLAGIGNRALALLIDYIVLGLTFTVMVLLATFLSVQITAFADFLGETLTGTIEMWLAAFFLLAFFALYIGYFVGFESAWQGQTPGKRWAKIRVIHDSGKPSGVFQATLRALMRPIDDIFFLGFFCIVFTKQEKRIGDWLAGTLVVQTERPLAKGELKTSEATKTLGFELLQRTSLEALLPDDFAVVREFLQRRITLTDPAKKALSQKLATQIQAIIHLETLPDNTTPEAFLEAVYWAYQQQFGKQR
jgi:uncharacterized RDD family membrane protein YckC